MNDAQYQAVLERVLREAAKGGDLQAKMAWRLMQGLPAVPLPAQRYSKYTSAAAKQAA